MSAPEVQEVNANFGLAPVKKEGVRIAYDPKIKALRLSIQRGAKIKDIVVFDHDLIKAFIRTNHRGWKLVDFTVTPF